MKKIFTISCIKELEKQVALGDISYSRMVEILNEMANTPYIINEENSVKNRDAIESFSFKSIVDGVKTLNWTLAIPAGGGKEDDEKLHGMIIGEDSYVNYIIKHLL